MKLKKIKKGFRLYYYYYVKNVILLNYKNTKRLKSLKLDHHEIKRKINLK